MENKIIEEILKEKERQVGLWGIQNHNIVNYEIPHELRMSYYSLPREQDAKKNCNKAAEIGNLTWGDIIVEELVEALNAKTPEEMREELIQCCAVLLSMVESLQRNSK